MTKYVVGYEEWCLFVCKTRADAEEMVLSLAEENLYENWLMDNCTDTRWEDRPYETPAEYIASYGKNYDEMGAHAWALCFNSESFWVAETEELD
jgi:hypothetical protein